MSDQVTSQISFGTDRGEDASADPGEVDLPDSVRTSRIRLVLTCLVVLIALMGVGIGAYWVFGNDETARSGDTVTFDFDEDGGLAADEDWRAITGEFSVAGGVAQVDVFNDNGPRTIAVTDIGATNARLDGTAGQMTAGWGLVFRYVGPLNYWYVASVPDFGVFNIVRVADGEATVVGRTDLVPMRDGMTIGIDLSGPTIRVFDDEKLIFTIDDDHALGATSIGLLATEQAKGASWDELTARLAAGGPAQVIIRRQADPRSAEDPETSRSTTVTPPDEVTDPASDTSAELDGGESEPAVP